MKRLFVILMTCIMLFAFTSCAPDAGGSVTEVPETKVVMEGSSLREGKIFISGDTEIIINNTGDGLYSIKTDVDAGSRTAAVAETPSNLLQLNDGAYVATGKTVSSTARAVEDSKVLVLHGRDLGVSTTGHIIINKMHVATDLKIEESNPDDNVYYDAKGYPVYEEYYHLDKEAIKKYAPDLAHVVISLHSVGSGAGSTNYGYVNIDRDGNIHVLEDSFGLYDLSEVESIDLINSMTIVENTGDTKWSQEIIISNPKEVILKDSDVPFVGNAIELESVSDNFVIPASENSSDIYVLELEVADYNWISSEFDYRDKETGRNHRFPIEMSRKGRNRVFYLGELKSESLITVSSVPHEEAKGFGKFLVRKATADEINEMKMHIATGENSKVLPITIPKGKFISYDCRLDLEGGLSRKGIDLFAYNPDGTFYDGRIEVILTSGHENGIGRSTSTIVGPYGFVKACDGEYLDKITVRIWGDQDKDVKLNFSVGSWNLGDGEHVSHDMQTAWVADYPDEAGKLTVKYLDVVNGKATAPAEPSREGFIFKGYKYIDMKGNSKVLQPGDEFELDFAVSHSIVTLWEPAK